MSEQQQALDAAYMQLLSWSPHVGTTLEKCLELDSNFVAAKLFALFLELLSNSNPKQENVQNLIQSLQAQQMTQHEKMVFDALVLYFAGKPLECLHVLEQVLVQDETHFLALKAVHDICFFLGEYQMMRDITARVFQYYKQLKGTSKNKLYGYVCGMYSFPLEETHDYERAFELAQEAIAVNADDVWAMHTLAHIFEMKGDFAKGIQILEPMRNMWGSNNTLSVHMHWHMCLFLLDCGNKQQEVLQVFDTIMQHTNAPFDLVDASSLLQRLQILGVDVGLQRWKPLVAAWQPRIHDKVLFFNDAHVCMTLVGAKEKQLALDHLQELQSNTDGCYNTQVTHKIGNTICKAIIHFDAQEYSKVIELLWPIKYQIQCMGGSHAQRDMYPIMLLAAAKHCNTKLYHSLVQERKAWKPNSAFLLNK